MGLRARVGTEPFRDVSKVAHRRGSAYGQTGYVALYRFVIPRNEVRILAIRHQRELGLSALVAGLGPQLSVADASFAAVQNAEPRRVAGALHARG
jgi:hypothetical protein